VNAGCAMETTIAVITATKTRRPAKTTVSNVETATDNSVEITVITVISRNFDKFLYNKLLG